MPWPTDLIEIAAAVPTLSVKNIPPFPFRLQPHVTITGPAWLAALKIDVAQGEAGARFKMGSLQQDLLWLVYRTRCWRAELAGNAIPRVPGALAPSRPRSGPRTAASFTKGGLVSRLTVMMRSSKLSRRDVNVTLRRVRSTTLSGATKEDLLWLIDTMNKPT